MSGADPRPALRQLSIPFREVVGSGYGYSGTFDPQGFFGHWTASAAGSNGADSAIAGRSYHGVADRQGQVALGGWAVRQGHGGWGRRAAQAPARAGTMTLDQIQTWQQSNAADDTSSDANAYFVAGCVDNNGVGEPIGEATWRAFTGLLAALGHANGLTLGHFIDHQASTARKIDLGGSPALDFARLYRDIGSQLELLTGGPPAMTRAVDIVADPLGRGYWIAADDGGVFTFGPGLPFYGSMGGKPLEAPICGMAATKAGDGYWLLGEDGGVFTFGRAAYHGNATGQIG